jgi:hypothetical protein
VVFKVVHIPSQLPYAIKLMTQQVGPEWSLRNVTELLEQPQILGWLSHLHLHSVEGCSYDELRQIFEKIELTDKRLVFTVHDLEGQHDDPVSFEAKMRFAISNASHVLTLTKRAAEIILLRFGTIAEVTPHGYGLGTDPPVGSQEFEKTWVAFGSTRSSRNITLLVDLWSKGFRTGDLPELVLALRTDSVAVARPPTALPNELGARNGVRVIRHSPERMSDAFVYNLVRGAIGLVLPYSRATHSSQFELAADFDVACVTPLIGCVASQAEASRPFEREPVWLRPNFFADETEFSMAELCAAVRTATQQRTGDRSDVNDAFRKFRVREHQEILRQHEGVYAGSPLASSRSIVPVSAPRSWHGHFAGD